MSFQMNIILRHFTVKVPIIAAIAWAAGILIIASGAGMVSNTLSKKPLRLLKQSKAGIVVIDTAAAFRQFQQKALIVDARTAEIYRDGHIPGAVNLDYFSFERAFAAFAKRYPASTPLVIYCEGISGPNLQDTCQTSRLLAEQLMIRGYRHLLLFEQGYALWEGNGYPVEQGGPGKPIHRGAMPFVSYLRDLGMLVLGLLAVLLRKNQRFVLVAQIVLGMVFIISGSTKLFHPDKLAVIIESYRILPVPLVPLAAVCMPWIELASGLCMVTGLFFPAAALIVSGMNLFFIPALTYRMIFLAGQLGISIFNVDFDCGCGLGENFAWVLILRDFGFLMMGLIVLLSSVILKRTETKATGG